MTGFFDLQHSCDPAAMVATGTRREGALVFGDYRCHLCGLVLSRELDSRVLLDATVTRTRWSSLLAELDTEPTGGSGGVELDTLVGRWDRRASA
jgi:hypothetical protein